MERTYYILVINHRRTCDPDNKTVRQVPDNGQGLRENVIKMLTENGYDLNGNKIEN